MSVLKDEMLFFFELFSEEEQAVAKHIYTHRYPGMFGDQLPLGRCAFVVVYTRYNNGGALLYVWKMLVQYLQPMSGVAIIDHKKCIGNRCHRIVSKVSWAG